MKFLISSRERPDLNIPKFLVQGEAFEISGEELRFSYDEMLEALGMPLDPEISESLFDKSEG